MKVQKKITRKIYLKNLNKYKLNSVLSKVFISYITILGLIVFSSGFTYYSVRNILVDKEISMSRDYLNYLVRIIDSEFYHMKESIYGFLQDTNNRLKLQDIGNSSKQYELTNELSRFKHGQELVEKCFLYSNNLPYVLSNDGSIDKELLYEIFKDSSGEENTRAAIKNYIENSSGFQFIPTSEIAVEGTSTEEHVPKHVIMLATGLSYSSNDNRLLVMVDEANIRSIVNNTSIKNYGSVFIVDSSSNIISSSKASMVSGKFDSKILDIIKSGDSSTNSFMYKNNLIVFEKSDFADMYYITAIPYNNIVKNIDKVKNVFVYVVAFILLVGFAIALIFSRNFYNPIANLISAFRPGNVYENTCRDEFSALQGLFQNLQIKSDKYEENDMIISTLLRGEAKESIKGLFKHKYSQVVSVISQESQKAYECSLDFAKENITEDFEIKIVKESKAGFSIVFNYDEPGNARVMEYVYRLKDYIYNKRHIFIKAGIGDICNSTDLEYSYRNAAMAIKYGDSSNEDCIYEYRPDMNKNCNLEFPQEFEGIVNDSIYKRSKNSLTSYIDSVFERNTGLPNLYMKNLLVEFINVYLKMAQRLDRDINIEEINNFVEDEYRISNIKEYISNLYMTLIEEDCILTDKAKQVGDYILKYIHNNYFDQNITIDRLADELELSSAYVSTLFKKATGVGFSQYLLDYRLNKAKEFLENTEEKVKSISDKSGFGTYNNFAKAFKKKFGVSPTDYRNIKIEDVKIY